MAQNLMKKAAQELPADVPKTVIPFLEKLYDSMPAEDRGLVDPGLLAATARQHHKLSKERRNGAPRISIRSAPAQDSDDKTLYTLIDIVSDDRPFIVDSVAAEITQNYRLIHLLIHPLILIKRDRDGSFISVADAPGDGIVPQSHIHIQLQDTLPGPVARELEAALYRVLSDVYYATRDWQAMRAKLRECQKIVNNLPADQYNDLEIEEYIHFLDYLYKDNFTLLGYRAYRFRDKDGKVESVTVKGSSLGLLHDDIAPVYINEHDHGLTDRLQKLRRDMPPLTVSKVNRRATVHRAVPLDAIAVKEFDKNGKVIGEHLFIGLFTSVTYSRSIQDVPLIRSKVERVMRRSGFKPGSHDYKALRHVLEKYPRDELFQIEEAALLETCLSILNLHERQRIALYTRADPFGRYVSCLVYVPRDRYDTRLRLKIQTILEDSFAGKTGDFYTNLDDSPLARVMFIIYINRKSPPRYDLKAIEKKLQEAGQLWQEKLNDVLLAHCETEDEALACSRRYGEAFPVNYRELYEPKQALFDIRKIDEVLESGALALDLYKCKSCEPGQIRLKVFHAGAPMTLSDILPVLENMGVRVISEMPFEVAPSACDGPVWIHDFQLELDYEVSAKRIDQVKDIFEEALALVWISRVENDSLNSLVLGARMPWRDIKILRAYVHYMRQIGYYFGTRYIEQALTNNPNIARELVKLFYALHDPAGQDKAAVQATGCMVAIDHKLETVESLDEDRILRSLANLIDATLRTNHFQTDKNGAYKPYLALKLDSAKIKDIPQPVPYREIFVYAVRFEGVHLRGDVIARGGIRWSDRQEDFRTEILGLMKAQQVKNSVIVPMGAKGGFVIKNPPAEGGRAAFNAEGIACYKQFISGLLDITDNRKGKKVIRPAQTVCRDDEDPYLVVAADKGTASFSDTANGIAAEYDFWLGDAFASGGSAGYDHKVMGITARGAWESVKRHFRELNHDTQSQPFDVVGVGDMGGDVFGNGMLLSKHIRLIGAFNHLHIVCDPDPDPAESFKERKRLFRAVKGWDAYNEEKLSRGGRIFLRTEKSLSLTPEIRARFEIEQERVSPNELIQAMLKARTDLLWFGGIGTYIKAAAESHGDVGDKANDPLRINAGDVRARVIGEGANLAVTQAARIEYAKSGGRLNADFIDNAGGVASSDHEVNIKILLAEVMRSRKQTKQTMTLKRRNTLLESMTDEVAALVLRNNYQQAQGISLMEMRAAQDLPVQARFIRDLERRHGIDRTLEGLPDEEEIERRIQGNKGLTRPELSVLQAYAKILFTKDLLASDIPDRPEMHAYWLANYFPTPLRKKYAAEIKDHRLRREIVATTMATSLVNRMGPTFIKEMMDKTGASCAAVARAYLIVREAFDIRAFWDEIEALDNKVPAQVQLKAMAQMAGMMTRETLWFLTRLGRAPDMKKDTAAFGAGIRTLYKHFDQLAPASLALAVEQRTAAGINDGLPEALARQIALIPTMAAAFDIIRTSTDTRADLPLTGRIYFALGEYFHIDWLRRQARFMQAEDRWAAEAIDGMIDELHQCQAGLTAHILQSRGKTEKTGGKADIVDEWVSAHAPQARQLEPLFEEMRRAGSIDLPMLLIAGQRLRALYGG